MDQGKARNVRSDQSDLLRSGLSGLSTSFNELLAIPCAWHASREGVPGLL